MSTGRALKTRPKPSGSERSISACMPNTRSGGKQVAFITDEIARGMARMMAERAAVDPEFAEDCESLLESKDYITHPGGMSKPEKCECCGTLVTVVPEVPVGRREEPKPAIWEVGAWRKHTPRRCNWKRGQA